MSHIAKGAGKETTHIAPHMLIPKNRLNPSFQRKMRFIGFPNQNDLSGGVRVGLGFLGEKPHQGEVCEDPFPRREQEVGVQIPPVWSHSKGTIHPDALPACIIQFNGLISLPWTVYRGVGCHVCHDLHVMPLQRLGPPTPWLYHKIENLRVLVISWSIPPGDHQRVTLEDIPQTPRQDRHVEVLSRCDGTWSSELNPEDDRFSCLCNADDLCRMESPVPKSAISIDQERPMERGGDC